MSKYGRFNFGSTYAVSPGLDEVALEDSADGELYRLRRELAALKATLADRETALGNAALNAQNARAQWQQESQRALSDAEQAWRADEGARFAAAEAHWQEQTASVLAEAIARYEKAELELEQLKRESAGERTQSMSVATPAQRTNLETKFEEFLSETESERGSRTPESRIVLRPDRVWAAKAAEAVEQRRRTSARNYALAGVVGAASLGLLAIAVLAGVLRPLPGGSDIPKANSSQDTAIVQATAIVVRDVNVRASPSATAPVVSTLPRGLKVTMIEQRDAWTLVLIEGRSPDMTPQRGWVYRIFLKAE